MKHIFIFSLIAMIFTAQLSYADGRGYTCPLEAKVIQLKNKMHLLKSQYDFYTAECSRLEDSLEQLASEDPSAAQAVERLKQCVQKADTFKKQMLENLAAQACKPV